MGIVEAVLRGELVLVPGLRTIENVATAHRTILTNGKLDNRNAIGIAVLTAEGQNSRGLNLGNY